jgi:hypothetical protein
MSRTQSRSNARGPPGLRFANAAAIWCGPSNASDARQRPAAISATPATATPAFSMESDAPPRHGDERFTRTPLRRDLLDVALPLDHRLARQSAMPLAARAGAVRGASARLVV